MQVYAGDLWDWHSKGHWACIPTNGVVTATGLVMGRAMALQAADRFPGLKKSWGTLVAALGNQPFPYPTGRLISFPTKVDWRSPSTLALVKESLAGLHRWVPFVQSWYAGQQLPFLPICLPKVGCGLGNLDWNSQVFPLLSETLDDNFIAIV